MNQIYSFYLVLFLLNFSCYLFANSKQLSIACPPAYTKTECAVCDPVADSLALVAFNQAMNGPNWEFKWTSGVPMGRWFGISLNEQGCVKRIDLIHNQVKGYIPGELSQISQLEELFIFFGEIDSISSEIGHIHSLSFLLLEGCNIRGNILPELGQLTNLTRLYLNDNQLSGNIPPELGQLTKLTELRLNDNQLSGNIPPELGRLTKLTNLELHHNQLSGDIPSELGQLTKLIYLRLNNNQLSGNIPSELGQLGELTHFYIYHNQLSGSIPPELGQLSQLQFLNASYNNLSGNLPPELGQLLQLLSMNFRYNQLTGGIPAEFGQLTNLYYSHHTTGLLLSHNQLSGCFPIELRPLCKHSVNSLAHNLALPSFRSFCSDLEGSCTKLTRYMQLIPTVNNGQSCLIFKDALDARVGIQVYNSVGQLIQNHLVKISYKWPLDLTSESNGLYFVVVSLNDEKTILQVIKN